MNQSPVGQGAATHVDRVLALFEGHRLSPAQRRIAQYLLDHLPEAAFLTSVALAERVGVSQPSVTRFATTLGFAGYPELREALRPIVLRVDAEHDVGGAGTAERVRRTEAQAAIEDERRNLAALHGLAEDPERLVAIGRDLAASTPLAVLGLRVSAGVATYFAYGARRIHPDVRLVTSGGTAALDALTQAKAAGGSCLVAFVMPRYAAEAVAGLREARDLGLRTVVVTDTALVPFADLADVLLPAGVGSRLVFDSQAGPMMLAALLLEAVADAEPARAQVRLEAYESFADRHGVYVG